MTGSQVKVYQQEQMIFRIDTEGFLNDDEDDD